MPSKILVDRCLEEIGYLSLNHETRLIIEQGADHGAKNRDSSMRERVKEIVRLIAATHEYQRA